MNRKIAEKLIRGWFKEPVLSAEDELTKALDTAEQRGREEMIDDLVEVEAIDFDDLDKIEQAIKLTKEVIEGK